MVDPGNFVMGQHGSEWVTDIHGTLDVGNRFFVF